MPYMAVFGKETITVDAILKARMKVVALSSGYRNVPEWLASVVNNCEVELGKKPAPVKHDDIGG